MNNADEFCRLVNSMKIIKSISIEWKYDIYEEVFKRNVIMICAESEIYYGEELLKLTFSEVIDFDIDNNFHMILNPFIEIHNISDWHWEKCRFLVEEIEHHFTIKCNDFTFEWLPPEEFDI